MSEDMPVEEDSSLSSLASRRRVSKYLTKSPDDSRKHSSNASQQSRLPYTSFTFYIVARDARHAHKAILTSRR